MMRLAMMRLVEGGRDVPVAIKRSEEGWSGESVSRVKKRRGTLPQVRGPMKDAMADWPGWRKRENLCTLFGVFPACENS